MRRPLQPSPAPWTPSASAAARSLGPLVVVPVLHLVALGRQAVQAVRQVQRHVWRGGRGGVGRRAGRARLGHAARPPPPVAWHPRHGTRTHPLAPPPPHPPTPPPGLAFSLMVRLQLVCWTNMLAMPTSNSASSGSCRRRGHMGGRRQRQGQHSAAATRAHLLQKAPRDHVAAARVRRQLDNLLKPAGQRGRARRGLCREQRAGRRRRWRRRTGSPLGRPHGGGGLLSVRGCTQDATVGSCERQGTGEGGHAEPGF